MRTKLYLDPQDRPLNPLLQLGRKPRLLIVDDQPVNIQALYQVFAADYQVFMATSGPQALGLCRDKHPDLVLLDIQMPGMDGFEVCRQIKADAELQDLPVVFVTAHSEPKAETEGLEVGAVDFISKPFNPAVVRARVKTHLTLKLQGDLLRQMVFIDGLTGVYNRRFFDERLEREFQRARRSASSLALIVVDVDYFKRYNDHYGHLAGDEALRAVASTLLGQLKRPGDMVSRYGGEEFACILPETDLAGAMCLAEEMEAAIRAAHIAHAYSDVCAHLTVSLGVASFKPDGTRLAEELIQAADQQLYLAKSKGRGRASGAEA
ncbi:diguanylate cyclase [Roseateles oligotrophus]|uniref:diguanylate cyclase n=1 Tax=Roseateles oligotrophus TaxID=1769250 RepID=A0ABT2YK14_9BURK|nr:diguanylate cyclase [Roseateles oligotrophus]MCV2370388.1 diguanylate cyclase [Roseateles oligotrophus]